MSPARPDRRTLLALLLGAVVLAGSPLCAQEEHVHAPGEPGASVEADNDPRVIAIASQLTCYCGCTTQSVADCTCGVAQKERRAILAQLDEGLTPDAVVAGWVERFGSRILMEPPRQGFNLLAWFLPGTALTMAAIFLAWRIRRWSLLAASAPAAEAPAAPPDSPYAQQLREELERRRG